MYAREKEGTERSQSYMLDEPRFLAQDGILSLLNLIS